MVARVSFPQGRVQGSGCSVQLYIRCIFAIYQAIYSLYYQGLGSSGQLYICYIFALYSAMYSPYIQLYICCIFRVQDLVFIYVFAMYSRSSRAGSTASLLYLEVSYSYTVSPWQQPYLYVFSFNLLTDGKEAKAHRFLTIPKSDFRILGEYSPRNPILQLPGGRRRERRRGINRLFFEKRGCLPACCLPVTTLRVLPYKASLSSFTTTF